MFNMLNIYDLKSCCVRGTPRTNAHLICRLSHETKKYPIRKPADKDGSNRLYSKSPPIPSNSAQIVQYKSFNLTTGAAYFK